MRMLLCTIGSKRRKGTLRIGAEVAKALSADTTLLGIVSQGANTELLTAALDKIAQELTELDWVRTSSTARRAGFIFSRRSWVQPWLPRLSCALCLIPLSGYP